MSAQPLVDVKDSFPKSSSQLVWGAALPPACLIFSFFKWHSLFLSRLEPDLFYLTPRRITFDWSFLQVEMKTDPGNMVVPGRYVFS